MGVDFYLKAHHHQLSPCFHKLACCLAPFSLLLIRGHSQSCLCLYHLIFLFCSKVRFLKEILSCSVRFYDFELHMLILSVSLIKIHAGKTIEELSCKVRAIK